MNTFRGGRRIKELLKGFAMALALFSASTAADAQVGKIEQIKTKQGVNGLHIMAVGWEEIVPRIVREAGLLPEGFVEPPPMPKEPAKEKKPKLEPAAAVPSAN